jgi:prepilin-type N-terminal cleavage/methylation domain-containing protein
MRPAWLKKILSGRRKKGSRGMTLIEVITAAAIFAFCLSGLLLTYMNLFTLTELTRDFTLATNAMQARMEEIKRIPFVNLASLNNATFTVTGFTAGNVSGVSQVFDTAYSDLKQVRLVVCFKSKNRLIGEDANLNGALNAGEDANANGRLDSPAELVTFIANFN